MPSIPELFDALASEGEVEGFDAVFERAVAALDGRPVAEMAPRRRTGHRTVWVAVLAAAVVAAIAVPVIVSNNGDHATSGGKHVVITTSPNAGAPVYPNVAGATAAQLATWRWSVGASHAIESADVTLWDGREVLVLGITFRNRPVTRSAAGYDPATNTWRALPDPPVAIRAAVWTGREVLGWSVAASGAYGPGASYDPVAQRWRAIAASPNLCPFQMVAGKAQPQPVWDGTEAVLVGRDNVGCSSDAPLKVTAFNPSTGRWSTVPSPMRPIADDAYQQSIEHLVAHFNELGHALSGAIEAEANCAPKDTACRVRTHATYTDLHNAWVDARKQLTKMQERTALPTGVPYAVTLAVVNGRVVADVSWTTIQTSNNGTSATESITISSHLLSWARGAEAWTTVPGGTGFGPLYAVDGRIAIEPASPCPPGSRCLTGYYGGDLVDFSGHAKRITPPQASSTAAVKQALSTNDALVMSTLDNSVDCLRTNCNQQLSAWDPATGHWTILRLPVGVSLNDAQLVWTGHALVALNLQPPRGEGSNGVMHTAVLKPAR